MHHGNVQCPLQALLYIKALRCLDVFQVDASEGGCYTLYCLAELFRVFLGHLDVKDVDSTIYLEQQSLTLHHRLAAHGTDVAEAQYSCAVRYDSHQITFVSVFVGCVRVVLNL